MKYIKICYLDLSTIPKNYTFSLELNDDNSFHNGVGVSKDEINKYDNPKDPNNTLWEWLKNKGCKFNDKEVEKYKISRDEFIETSKQVTLDQRKKMKRHKFLFTKFRMIN